MAQKKRKAPVSRKRRSWTVPKLLLILGYGVVFVFLGVIFLMRQELFRVGIFGDKPAVRAPAPNSGTAATRDNGIAALDSSIAASRERIATSSSGSAIFDFISPTASGRDYPR